MFCRRKGSTTTILSSNSNFSPEPFEDHCNCLWGLHHHLQSRSHNHISLQGFEIYQVSNLMYNIECCDGIQTFSFSDDLDLIHENNIF